MRAPQIYVHRYLLRSQQALNSRSHTTEHEGALIRVEVDGIPGFGCLHPWVELGDLCLDELLKQLAEGRMSRQVKCALACAEIDRNARARGVSLFEGLDVPMSHATIAGGIDSVAQAVDAGFDTVKLKMGRDEEGDLRFLREIYDLFPSLRVRLDFNEVSSSRVLENLLKEVGEEIRANIDFIEDPFPPGDASFGMLRREYSVRLAVDRNVDDREGEYDVAVMKPAINMPEKICEAAHRAGRGVVVTSYMDHPVGQCYAAYCAGKMNGEYMGLIDQRCGLMTHGLYQETEFSHRMGQVVPSWEAEEGALGLGFDDLLEYLDWGNI